jgi:3-mercaptopyruvate sulfurtransferase SseA
MGHDVWVLDGGLPAWRNLPVEKPKRTYQVGNFESKFKPEGKTTEQILANIDSKKQF